MPPITALDQFDFHHRLGATPGVALVLFTAPACGACKRLRHALHAAAWPDVTIYEVDGARDLALLREFGIHHLPALYLYRDGHFHCELQAEAQPEALRRALERALSLPAAEAP